MRQTQRDQSDQTQSGLGRSKWPNQPLTFTVSNLVSIRTVVLRIINNIININNKIFRCVFQYFLLRTIYREA
jgi:hypothetical protein